MFDIGDIIVLKKDVFIWRKGTIAKVVGAMSSMFDLQKGKAGLHV